MAIRRTAGPGSPGERAQPASQHAVPRRLLAVASAIGLLTVAMALPVAAENGGRSGNRFVQTNLVSDVPGMAATTDPNLVNAWGMSASPTSPVWVSDNGMDVTTLYKGSGTPDNLVAFPFAPAAPLVVNIPEATGQVFNSSLVTTDWVVPLTTKAARFIFASESGSIYAWAGGTAATSAVTVPNAVYKGLAISTGAGGDFLYAANFHDGTIDVFDGSWNQVHWPGAFVDHRIPGRYAPFNIQNLGGMLYVTYAMQDAAAHDDVPGQGHGFVDVYDLSGNLVKRVVRHGQLNSPWGLAIAPAGFGRFGGDLLVGNFGDGHINAYSLTHGEDGNALRDTSGRRISIDGLWGLMFGNGVAGAPSTLIFSAGPGGEAHGLLGTITQVP